jgi:hypothetical protein
MRRLALERDAAKKRALKNQTLALKEKGGSKDTRTALTRASCELQVSVL